MAAVLSINPIFICSRWPVNVCIPVLIWVTFIVFYILEVLIFICSVQSNSTLFRWGCFFHILNDYLPEHCTKNEVFLERFLQWMNLLICYNKLYLWIYLFSLFTEEILHWKFVQWNKMLLFTILHDTQKRTQISVIISKTECFVKITNTFSQRKSMD